MSTVIHKPRTTPLPQSTAKGDPRTPIRTGVKAGVWGDPHVNEKVHDGGDIWR